MGLKEPAMALKWSTGLQTETDRSESTISTPKTVSDVDAEPIEEGPIGLNQQLVGRNRGRIGSKAAGSTWESSSESERERSV